MTQKRRSAEEPRIPFRVRFWGVRGSVPTPGPRTQRYGGNTPCIEMRCGDELLIFDMGTGARALGETLCAESGEQRASIFLSHYHYDHMQGVPFFVPLFSPRFTMVVHGATREGRTVKDMLTGQMVPPYFPVTLPQVTRASLSYRDIEAGQLLELGPATVRTMELNHPGGNLGYRVDCDGRSVVYATDMEHGTHLDAALVEFARGADVLIIDAMYTEEEYRGLKGSPKEGWGHATWEAGVRIANSAQVEQLVLFHHDPTRDDEQLDALLALVREHRPEAIAAREQEIITL